jgi:ketosteroid isomerase-like protein
MRSTTTPQDTPPAFVTSVLTLRDGKISAARTYTDLRGHARYAGPEAS